MDLCIWQLLLKRIQGLKGIIPLHNSHLHLKKMTRWRSMHKPVKTFYTFSLSQFEMSPFFPWVWHISLTYQAQKALRLLCKVLKSGKVCSQGCQLYWNKASLSLSLFPCLGGDNHSGEEIYSIRSKKKSQTREQNKMNVVYEKIIAALKAKGTFADKTVCLKFEDSDWSFYTGENWHSRLLNASLILSKCLHYFNCIMRCVQYFRVLEFYNVHQ